MEEEGRLKRKKAGYCRSPGYLPATCAMLLSQQLRGCLLKVLLIMSAYFVPQMSVVIVEVPPLIVCMCSVFCLVLFQFDSKG